MATKSFEDRLQRLEDVREIENLMAKYAYLHTGVASFTFSYFAFQVGTIL